MISYPNINPVALDLGFAQVHWYGLMYLIGFMGSWWLGVKRAAYSDSDWNNEQVSDVIFYGALGVILGGRIGYILFYNFTAFKTKSPNSNKIFFINRNNIVFF